MIGGAVPNYSGLFLRGHGGQTSYHYNAVWHGSGNLGAIQGDAVRNITGRIAGHWPPAGYIQSGALFTTTSTGYNHNASHWNYGVQIVNMDVSRIVPTAVENRPVNTAVRYLIRAL